MKQQFKALLIYIHVKKSTIYTVYIVHLFFFIIKLIFYIIHYFKMGNFKVAVKIRQLNCEENNIEVINDNRVILINKQDSHKKNEFCFDYTFNNTVKQIEFYKNSVFPLVDHFLLGDNATVLCYGQTGSGKTYTMGTNFIDENADNEGIICRVVDDIFNSIDSTLSDITLSYLEIHNNKMIDLLFKEKSFNSQKKLTTPLLQIQRCQSTGMIKINNLSIIPVKNALALRKVIQDCSRFRTTAATTMNQNSSRSHALFTIYLNNKESNKITKFSLIDLAGSEKPDDSNKLLKKEGICINQGLSLLKLTLIQLARHENVTFRGNDLVRLLEDSFTGNSRSLFIACVNPMSSNYNESLNTLRFADSIQRLKNIKKIINEESQSILNKELIELREFKEKIQNKKTSDACTSPIKELASIDNGKQISILYILVSEINFKNIYI